MLYLWQKTNQQTESWRYVMTGIYFSGTGNTKFCVDTFLKEYGYSTNSFSIEDNETGSVK